MKKLYFLLFATALFSAKSQNSFQIKNLDNGGAIVSNNQVFTKNTTAGGLDFTHHLEVKNTSAVTHTYAMVKYENNINTVSQSDKAQAYFCFNTYCYIPSIMSASVVLTAGETFSFYPKLDEASVIGESNVSYEFMDLNNGSDNLTMEMRYNTGVSVKENLTTFSAISSLYPNPSSSHAYMDVTTAREVNGTTLKVYNALGAVVYTKQVTLEKGKNTLNIETRNMEAGVYFVSLSNGSFNTVKKLTVTK